MIALRIDMRQVAQRRIAQAVGLAAISVAHDLQAFDHQRAQKSDSTLYLDLKKLR